MRSAPGVEQLRGEIAALVRDRQQLRTADACDALLERNRLELVRAQWKLCYALIDCRGWPRQGASEADREGVELVA